MFSSLIFSKEGQLQNYDAFFTQICADSCSLFLKKNFSRDFFSGIGQTFIRIVNVYYRRKGCRSSTFLSRQNTSRDIHAQKPAFLTDNIINNTVEQYAIFITYLESLPIYDANFFNQVLSLKAAVSLELEISIFSSHPWV
jgi:hypothetical protein